MNPLDLELESFTRISRERERERHTHRVTSSSQFKRVDVYCDALRDLRYSLFLYAHLCLFRDLFEGEVVYKQTFLASTVSV